MPSLPRHPFQFPPAGVALVVLCALYLFPGAVGHDPWKPDDATHLGIAYSMLREGSWLVLKLAGETYLDNPPLYYWVATIFGQAIGWLLPLHDAMRMASAFFAVLMLASVAGAARELYGEAVRGMAPLLTIGCLGLLVHVHEAQPQIAVLAALSGTLFGLALIPRRPYAGSSVAGLAIGLGFLAGGLGALAFTLPLALFAPFVGQPWRSGKAFVGLGLLLTVGAAVSLSWPIALALLDPKSLEAWWSHELTGLQPMSNIALSLRQHAAMLTWFAWPAWPLVLWALWGGRKTLGKPGIALPMLSLIIAATVLVLTQEAHGANDLPLLLPLALLASPAAGTLRRGAANALDWFSMTTFTLIAGLIWLGWVAMLTGWPSRLARKVVKLEPGFMFEFSVAAFVFALVVTFAWLWFIVAGPRTSQRGAVNWAAGMTFTWCLLNALWMQWIEYGKSYRMLSASLAHSLPKNTNCIAGRDIGDAQRASLHYFNGILTRRDGTLESSRCRILLMQASGRGPEIPPGAGWKKIWENRRPGDRYESFRLYRKG